MPKIEKKSRRDNRQVHRQEAAPYEDGEVEDAKMGDDKLAEEEEHDSNSAKKKRHHKIHHREDKGDDRRKKKQRHGQHDNRHGHQKSHRPSNNDDMAPCATFDEMNLKPDLLKGVYAYGFEKPSAIQQRAIRPIVRGRDVIAQSQSGTGKTAVFSIASLQLLDSSSRDVQVLVLSPTRELAEQSQRVMQSLGDFMNVSELPDSWVQVRRGALC